MQSPADDLLKTLSDLLERHRETLRALEGVVGTAVGVTSTDVDDQELAVQIFVESDDHVEPVREAASRILGTPHLAILVSGEMAPLNEGGREP